MVVVDERLAPADDLDRQREPEERGDAGRAEQRQCPEGDAARRQHRRADGKRRDEADERRRAWNAERGRPWHDSVGRTGGRAVQPRRTRCGPCAAPSHARYSSGGIGANAYSTRTEPSDCETCAARPRDGQASCVERREARGRLQLGVAQHEQARRVERGAGQVDQQHAIAAASQATRPFGAAGAAP